MKPRPSQIILRARRLLKPGTVLDIGVGNGDNALYLGEKGFSVIGIDHNEKLINDLINRAKELGVADQVKVETADVLKYAFGKYENIICNFVLHFLPVEQFKATLDKIKAATVPGGINVISVFTKEGLLYDANVKGYWLEKGELSGFYADWEIIHYEEATGYTRELDDDGYPKYQLSAHIIARKSL